MGTVFSRLVLLFLLGVAGTLVAADAPPRVPINQWMDGPESHLPGWKVETSDPLLAFPLRWAVVLKGGANVRGAKLEGHELHFFVKVADRNGNWFGARRHSSISKLPKGTDVTATERFFAKPGDYLVAFAVFDATVGSHGVWKLKVHVPELDVPLSYPEAEAIQFIEPEEPFTSGSAPAVIPLQNQKPLRLDVIINLTERNDLEVNGRQDFTPDKPRRGGYGTFRIRPDWQMGQDRQEFVTETLLSIGQAIAAVKPNGCTRISVVDAVRAKVLVDRRKALDARLMLNDMRERRSTHKIDAHVLALRQQSGSFLHNFLQTVITDNSGCDELAKFPARAIVLISDALVLPESKQLTPVPAPPVEPVTKFFFFRMTVHEYLQRIGMGRAYALASASPDDQVGKLLSNLEARRFDLSEPKDFLKAFPKFLDAVKQ